MNKDVTRVGEDYFIMPEEDVTIKATWGKVTIAKSMDGTVNKLGDPIMKQYISSTTDYHSSTYKSKITSIVTKDNLEIPNAAIEYWDVSAAGDGSVIAYIEDDGRGEGTYKVTIGGQGGIIANPNSSYLFYNFTNLEGINLTYLDTSQVTDMSYMFSGCSNLTSLDVSHFDTSNVTNMRSMFYYCKNLTSLDVSHFDTSKVTDMPYMFYYCNSLASLDISNFDTSNVTNMGYMFYGCSDLTSLDMQNADFSSVTSYNYMFSSVNSNINVIVKDSTAQSFIRARLDDDSRPNATVTIAGSGTLTSYRFDRVPEFGNSFFLYLCYNFIRIGVVE